MQNANFLALSAQGASMKRRFDIHILSLLLLMGLAASAMAGEAQTVDIPKRKTGLWEINMQMDGAPNMGAIQQCIDQNTDNMMQQYEKKANSDCSVMDIKHQGNKFTLHSVCKFGGTVTTSDAVFTGSFESAYKGEIKTSYNPPLHGRAETKVSLQAKWLSPCQPGQKSGDVILPNMKGVNINEMMNSPKFQEMLKQQK